MDKGFLNIAYKTQGTYKNLNFVTQKNYRYFSVNVFLYDGRAYKFKDIFLIRLNLMNV